MGNKNLIITIEREYGSGGRIAGKKLAEELGLHFYDDEILKLTSEKSAVGEQFFRLADEKAGNNLLYKLGAGRKLDISEKPSSTAKLTTPENLFKFQSSVIRELANEESCVIVGRAAGFVLDQDEEMERLIRIFVYADKVKKVQRVMEVDCIDEERAKRRIKKIEQERKAYYKYFTGSEWHSMKNYDLPINTTKLTFDETAELIKMYIGLKG
ncbi:MAG: cytidylate kinase-like family protein, partial [Clostridium sp.]